MNHNWQRKWHNTEERTAIHSLSLLTTQFEDVPASPPFYVKMKLYLLHLERDIARNIWEPGSFSPFRSIARHVARMGS